MTRAGVCTSRSSCAYIFFLPLQRYDQVPCLLHRNIRNIKDMKSLLSSSLSQAGSLIGKLDCTHATCSLSHIWQGPYVEPRQAMWLCLCCITLKSPFNRQSHVTPHLINSRLVNSLLCPTHISVSESPTGAGLVAGITSRVKWFGARHVICSASSLNSKDLLGQSAVVVEKTQLPLSLSPCVFLLS